MPRNSVEDSLFGSGKSRSEIWWKEFCKVLLNYGYIVEVKAQMQFGCITKLSQLAENWLASESEVKFYNFFRLHNIFFRNYY